MSLPATDPDLPATVRAPRPRWLTAVGWALAGATCAGVPWAAVLLAAQECFGLTFSTANGSPSLVFGCVLFLGWPYGFLAGVVLGLLRRRDHPDTSTLLLSLSCAFFGAIGGSLILLAVEVCPRLHPIVSSSLAASVVGFLAGLCGYAAARPAPRAPEEDEEPVPPAGAKVEWLLRERKRDWRLPRPLRRVLPVLLTTAAILIIAAVLAPSDTALALLGVVALGLATAFVLYRQEERLEALERHLRRKHE
jgi:hypothetical protein